MILVEDKLGLFLNIKTYKNYRCKLFDFRSKEFNEINTIIENKTFLIRKEEKIMRVDNQSEIESRKGEELLFYIRKSNNGIYSIENPISLKNISFIEDNINILNNKIWYVLNSKFPNDVNQSEDFFLCKYDIIKMGNIKLMVKDIHIEENEKIKQNIDNKIINYDIHSLNEESGDIFNISPEPKKYIISSEEAKKQNKICIICNKDECSIEDPIISFCNCNNLFHFNCFKKSLQEKVFIKSNETKAATNYYIKWLYCKNCKLNYPLQFKIKEREPFFEFINIGTPKEGNYIILESIENKIYYGYIKFVFVVKVGEKEINIGRKRENDIIIPDPSISKVHAEMKLDKGNIYIKNKSETYGSSILIKKALKINNNKISLQIGRTIIESKEMKFGEFEKLKLKNKIKNLTKKD